ncbi:MAG: GntR family transcriptional regulator, partial [Lentisphaerae bacterium]
MAKAKGKSSSSAADDLNILEDVRLPKGYFKVRRYVRETIVRNGLKVGDSLPTHKEMAAALKLNHITLAKVLRLLEREGLVELRPRSGTYVGDLNLGTTANVIFDGIRGKHSAEEQARIIAIHISPQYKFWDPHAVRVYAPEVIQQTFAEHGYKIVLEDNINEPPAYDPAGYLLISPTMTTEMLNYVNQLDRAGAKYLITHGHFGQTFYNVVSLDMFRGGEILMEHLIAQGHRRIAFIGKEAAHMEDRYNAYIHTLLRHGIPVVHDYIYRGTVNRQTIEAAFHKFMTLEQRPSAVMCFNDEVAAYFIDFCREAGLRVPQD